MVLINYLLKFWKGKGNKIKSVSGLIGKKILELSKHFIIKMLILLSLLDTKLTLPRRYRCSKHQASFSFG